MPSDQKAKSISSEVEKSKEESKEEVIVEPKQKSNVLTKKDGVEMRKYSDWDNNLLISLYLRD